MDAGIAQWCSRYVSNIRPSLSGIPLWNSSDLGLTWVDKHGVYSRVVSEREYLLDGSRGERQTGTGGGGSGSDAPDVAATGSEEQSESVNVAGRGRARRWRICTGKDCEQDSCWCKLSRPGALRVTAGAGSAGPMPRATAVEAAPARLTARDRLNAGASAHAHSHRQYLPGLLGYCSLPSLPSLLPHSHSETSLGHAWLPTKHASIDTREGHTTSRRTMTTKIFLSLRETSWQSWAKHMFIPFYS